MTEIVKFQWDSYSESYNCLNENEEQFDFTGDYVALEDYAKAQVQLTELQTKVQSLEKSLEEARNEVLLLRKVLRGKP